MFTQFGRLRIFREKIFLILVHIQYVYCGVGPELTVQLVRLITSSEKYL